MEGGSKKFVNQIFFKRKNNIFLPFRSFGWHIIYIIRLIKEKVSVMFPYFKIFARELIHTFIELICRKCKCSKQLAMVSWQHSWAFHARHCIPLPPLTFYVECLFGVFYNNPGPKRCAIYIITVGSTCLKKKINHKC